MFYLQENCIYVPILCVWHQSYMKFKIYNFLWKRKNLFLFHIIFIFQHYSLLCDNIIPIQSQFSLPNN